MAVNPVKSILNKLNVKNLEKTIKLLIENKKLRSNLQNLSLRNFYLTHEFITKKIDDFRSEKLQINSRRI